MEDRSFQILTELNEAVGELIKGEELTEFMDEREDKKSRKALYAGAAGTAAAGAAGAAALEKFRPGSLHAAQVHARRGAYRAGLAARLMKRRAGEAARNAAPHVKRGAKAAKEAGKRGAEISRELLKKSLVLAAALGIGKKVRPQTRRRPVAMMQTKKRRSRGK